MLIKLDFLLNNMKTCCFLNTGRKKRRLLLASVKHKMTHGTHPTLYRVSCKHKSQNCCPEQIIWAVDPVHVIKPSSQWALLA